MCDTLNDENDKNIENVNVFEGIMDLSAMDTEEIEMEEFDFSPDPLPEPTDTEWPPSLEELF